MTFNNQIFNKKKKSKIDLKKFLAQKLPEGKILEPQIRRRKILESQIWALKKFLAQKLPEKKFRALNLLKKILGPKIA